ncbi:MAG: nucleotidyltransferase family protein [Flavobacteriales bacterium]|nr:nucleotidyltransferase family protein [Flavobacteriales bacterium]
MNVLNKAELLEVLHLHGAEISAFGVERLGLFGSFARDEARADSDVDLLVEFDPARKSLRNLVGLSRFLHELLGRSVELVTPQSLNRFTAEHILKQVEHVPLTA